jgi:hypothetical protein
VHATRDKALRERIYQGQWEQIQAAEAEAARLGQERYERQQREQRREQRRIEAKREEEERQRQRELRRIETEREQLAAATLRWCSEHPWLVRLQRAKYLLVALTCSAVVFFFWQWELTPPNDTRVSFWTYVMACFSLSLVYFAGCNYAKAFARDVPLSAKVEKRIREAHNSPDFRIKIGSRRCE